jgi:hypothetical protein
MSYNKNTDKVTWKCYPTNVETFADVSYPIVDNVLQARKSLYENINHIDKLPNNDAIPDKVGSIDEMSGPKNKEPVRAVPNSSLEPVVVVTDVEPGMIMPGNLSFSLPNNSHESNALVYPNTQAPENKEHSLHGDVILKSPYVTIMETTQVNEPLRMQIDSNVLSVNEISEKHDSLRIMSQQEFHMATAGAPEHKEPVKITSVAQVQQSVELNQKPPTAAVAVESYPESSSLPVMSVTLKHKHHHKNKLMHKFLMYVSIALVIYLIYVLFYEK